MSSPTATASPARPAVLRRLPVPIPWNAELVFFLLVELTVGLICLVFDSVNAFDFLEVTKWTAAAYLVARGIAKAGRAFDVD
jgi:hypothetical protein